MKALKSLPYLIFINISGALRPIAKPEICVNSKALPTDSKAQESQRGQDPSSLQIGHVDLTGDCAVLTVVRRLGSTPIRVHCKIQVEPSALQPFA